uniref:Uncharacterized protein n=1 Tax=Cajanus cajan TaxID=3821 RepID=A0A151RLF6_CAJCA|nr:hypothetical protein KK1_035251 [Cajanus cajan]
MQSSVRFSSCRGVAFEVKPHADPFAITTAPPQHLSESKRFWPFDTSRVFPSSTERSFSSASSHFCDLEDEDQEDAPAESIPLENYDVEKQNPLPQLAVHNANSKSQQPSKPARKNESRVSVILLDQGLFTVYKRLFVMCLALNVTGLVLASTGHFPYARNRAALFSIGNILALTLCRSEAFLRVVFWVAVKTLGRSWVPLFLKTATTSLLQSLGGIHSGCGVSSIAWLVYALVLTLKDRDNTSTLIIGVSSSILALLCLTSLAAFPLVRHLHHNVFERTHRFAGWMALCLLWAFIMLTISYDPKSRSYSKELGSRVVKSQEFWVTVGITVLIIMPWLTVRRVGVKVSSASGHASMIRFEGGIKAGILGRISPSPLSEWHAFGIISDGKKEHMMLAGAVGDFTKSLGIEQNFGKEIKEMVSGYPKEKVILHDTAVLGRPNVSHLSVSAAKNWGVEVVIVTSNPEGSRDVVNACKQVGIAAFGPIWDS